jgi:hypothetical protein
LDNKETLLAIVGNIKDNLVLKEEKKVINIKFRMPKSLNLLVRILIISSDKRKTDNMKETEKMFSKSSKKLHF